MWKEIWNLICVRLSVNTLVFLLQVYQHLPGWRPARWPYGNTNPTGSHVHRLRRHSYCRWNESSEKNSICPLLNELSFHHLCNLQKRRYVNSLKAITFQLLFWTLDVYAYNRFSIYSDISVLFKQSSVLVHPADRSHWWNIIIRRRKRI